MTFLISLRRCPDEFLEHPPFPLAGALLGLIAVVNVASTTMMLLSL